MDQTDQSDQTMLMLKKVMEDSMAGMEERIGKKVKESMAVMKESMAVMEERIEKRIDNMEERMSTQITDMSTQITRLSDVTIESNPLAFLKFQDPPAVVTSNESIERAITEGGHATWTVLKYEEESGQESFVAVGSKHCGLYYNTNTKNISFVSLPDAIVRAGVRRVGFVNDVNSESMKDDAMIVLLEECPIGIEPEDITYYYHPTPNNRNFYSLCVGQSESGYVYGKNVVKDKNGMYLFVEDQREPGNSGTLMIVPANDKINQDKDAKILGVYFGTRKGSLSHLRPRGIVAPLPPMNDFQFYPPVQAPQHVTHLTVKDGGDPRECELTQMVENNKSHYTLQDENVTGNESVQWPGVLIQLDTDYSGYTTSGSARSR